MIASDWLNPRLSGRGLALVVALVLALPCRPAAAQPPEPSPTPLQTPGGGSDPIAAATSDGFLDPNEPQPLDALVNVIKRQIARYRDRGNKELADRLQDKLTQSLRRTREDYQDEHSSQMEVHVVGHYEGRSFGNIYPEALVRVTHRSAPIILCLTSHNQINWRVDVESGVDLRQVILGGREQFVEGLPERIPVADYSRPRTTRKGISAAYGREPESGSSGSSFDALAAQLLELTGLPISTFQGSYRPGETPLTVGPQSASWREQRAYEGVRQVFLLATSDDRKALIMQLSQLRFPAIFRQYIAQDRPGAFGVEESVSYGIHSVFGPILRDFVEVTGREERKELDPRGVCRPDQQFALINPATSRRDALPWGPTLELPEISHICAFAFDSKRNLWIVIGETRAGFQMFAASVKERAWSIIRPLTNIDLHAMCYSQVDDAYYGLAYKYEYGDGLALYKFDPAGAILAKNVVKGLKGRRGPDHRPWLQLVSQGEYLIAIVIRHGSDGQPRDHGDVYSNVINPRSGELLFTTKLLPAGSVEAQHAMLAKSTAQRRREAAGHLAALPEVKTAVRVTTPQEVEVASALRNPQNGHYYELVRTGGVLWKHAVAIAERRHFQGMRGYLVTITSQAENDFLVRNFAEAGPSWAGASDEDNEGVWKWICGPEAGTVFYRHSKENAQSIGYENWGRNTPFSEPNNSGGAEHYLVWNWDAGPDGKLQGKWNDWDADRQVDSVIVEYSK